MPRKTCTICKERKSVEMFENDSRSTDGVRNQCKECRTSYKYAKVQCENCKRFVGKSYLAKHQQSATCQKNSVLKEQEKPWKQFKSNGFEKVYCPCDFCKTHDRKVTEGTAYCHLRFGITDKLEMMNAKDSKPWTRFNSNGKEYVICPCQSEQCQVRIKEGTAYRHLKYGVGYKFPAELKRLKERENQRMPAWIITDSGLVRDLDD